jgi:hypothetical protein
MTKREFKYNEKQLQINAGDKLNRRAREIARSATDLEIAGFLNHIAAHPEDFAIDEITEILKQAAEIIWIYAGNTSKERDKDLDLEELDPAGRA